MSFLEGNLEAALGISFNSKTAMGNGDGNGEWRPGGGGCPH